MNEGLMGMALWSPNLKVESYALDAKMHEMPFAE